VVLEQISKVIGGGKGVIERLHGLVQVERELVDLMNEAGLEKNRLPDAAKMLINVDPEIARKGFEDGVKVLREEGV
jgi:hypothetical protein